MSSPSGSNKKERVPCPACGGFHDGAEKTLNGVIFRNLDQAIEVVRGMEKAFGLEPGLVPPEDIAEAVGIFSKGNGYEDPAGQFRFVATSLGVVMNEAITKGLKALQRKPPFSDSRVLQDLTGVGLGAILRSQVDFFIVQALRSRENAVEAIKDFLEVKDAMKVKRPATAPRGGGDAAPMDFSGN